MLTAEKKNKYGTDLLSIEHFLSSCETTAWKKIRPAHNFNPLTLRYRRSTLPTELKNQLGADHYVGFK